MSRLQALVAFDTPSFVSPQTPELSPQSRQGWLAGTMQRAGEASLCNTSPLDCHPRQAAGSDRASRLPWSSRKAGTVEGTQPMGALLWCSAHARQISIKSRPSRQKPTLPRTHELNSLADFNASRRPTFHFAHKTGNDEVTGSGPRNERCVLIGPDVPLYCEFPYN
jgi:hypothetical protein